MRRIKKFLRLSYEDKLLIVEAAVMLSAVTVGLFFLPFNYFVKQIYRFEKKSNNIAHLKKIRSDRVAWAVKSVGRYVPYARCLSQALTVKILLLNRDCPVQLRIGVTKSIENRIMAHAWIESRGRIIIGDLKELSRYHILPAIEERST
jgi:hypothetical protein